MPTAWIVLVLTPSRVTRAAGTCFALVTLAVTRLANKVENALNETRMLILGAQVLLGFQFQAVFQPGFERLPPPVQELKLIGLGLMLVAVGLLLTPGAFHQLVERGNDSERLISFTGWIAAFALLPFAAGMGIDVYIAAQLVVGPMAALAAAVLATGFALVFWYGLEWIWQARAGAAHSTPREQPMKNEGTDLANKIEQVLTEARVVLPGAQALLGFQLTAMLTDAFGTLPKTSQYVHLGSLGLIAACIVFLMAPASFHRIVERGEDSERLHRFASAMVVCAMVPLGLGIAGDAYVVVARVLGSTEAAISVAVASLVFFYGLWFGLTLVWRARLDGPPTATFLRAVR
jgi:hypothetical protein